MVRPTPKSFWMSPGAMLISGSGAPFAGRIPTVIRKRSQKQMLWIYAARIIATMKNGKRRWVSAIMDQERQAVCAKCLSLELKYPVSIYWASVLKRALPYPTFIVVASISRKFRQKSIKIYLADVFWKCSIIIAGWHSDLLERLVAIVRWGFGPCRTSHYITGSE